jgi:hypothetical protein
MTPGEKLRRPNCFGPYVGLALGAIAGAIITIGVQLLIMAFGQGENLIGLLLIPVWQAILWPALELSKAFGWAWRIGSVYEYPSRFFGLVLATNSALAALLGLVIAIVRNLLKRRN